jgi:hypothetical protein
VISGRATKRTLAAAALALALPVLAGCGFDSKDETSHEHSPVQAATNQIGAIRIRDAFITTPQTAGLAAPDATVTSYLVVTLVNNGSKPDTLTSVTTSLGTVTPSGGAVTLPPGVVIQISDPDIDPSAPTLSVTAPAPTVGTTEPVTFAFANAGTTRALDVPVVLPGQGLSPLQVIPTTQATHPTPIV